MILIISIVIMISVRSKKLKIKHYERCISEGAIYININMKRYRQIDRQIDRQIFCRKLKKLCFHFMVTFFIAKLERDIHWLFWLRF